MGDSIIHVSLKSEMVCVEIVEGKTAARAKLDLQESHRLAASIIERAAELEGLNPSEADWSLIPMQYLELNTVPSSADETIDENSEQSTVQCWIRGQTRKNAFHVACGWIYDSGRIVTELLEQRTVSRGSFEEESEEIQYYEQGLIDGEVFLFNQDSN